MRTRQLKDESMISDKSQSEEIIKELEHNIKLLGERGVDISELEKEMKPIEKFARLKWYDKVIEPGNVLLEKLKKRNKKERDRLRAEREDLMKLVRTLFEDCLTKELAIEHLYDMNEEAMDAYEREENDKAEELFNKLKRDLKRVIDEDNRRRGAWKEFDRLKKNKYQVLPPPNLESLIEEDIYKGEEKLEQWKDKIEKARQKMEKEKRVRRLEEDVNKLNKKRVKYGIKIEQLPPDLQSEGPLLKKGMRQKSEAEYNDIKNRLETAIKEYEGEQEATERAHISEKKRKRRNKIIAITSIAVVVLLIGSGIGGYIWYSWDSDGDGIRDAEDVYPNDPAASIDTDKDGWPDKWNEGKIEEDSTSNPKLHLDAFPNDPEEWADSDGDGYGDNKADTFPGNSDEWADNDGDGYGDNEDDKFPGNSDEWADNDGDGYGDNKADKFPNDKNEWVDSDGDGVGDNSDIAPNDASIKEINDYGFNFEWVNIFSGTFTMGSPYVDLYGDDDDYADDDEKPEHQVTISKEFQMLKYEVTQKQWKAGMGSNPSHSYGIGDNNPVYFVSWNNCQEFLSELNKLDSSFTYRLPTEAEWEYVCRAGSTTKFFFDDHSGQLSAYAWYYYNSDEITHPVGQKSPNAWGLYDIYGNVQEWCQDNYMPSYYEHSPDTDPQGPDGGWGRVMRGGSSWRVTDDCRSAIRYYDEPTSSFLDVGFRLVRVQS